MSVAPERPDPRRRVPVEPYPGLRPFLDFEAALLFGRERQVREVIERLRQTQFVAVLGGSGSGKSSLIHAGVTPELRSFGIPGAGDLWITMTCTPGTNVAQSVDGKREHTPITRLAWKFSALLRSRGSAEQDAERLHEIAEVFRQEGGFARLFDAYAEELDVPPGPDPKEARLLFVIDQFEELFHPTNRGIEDGSLMVERVIDHFFNPHPRAFVVLTMRSEHLNDCAGYLELPDAINRSSYLVRRLDEDELREAIVAPAQRFLRLCARADDAAALPDEVAFEPALLDRLLRDVSALTQDSDHLPLLQHLLARLWQAARTREGNRLPVPARITLDDLQVAVSGGTKTALDERTNTLRASLENGAEAAYRRHPAAQQPLLDALLRKLAFKDPNTGMYTQQRVNVDDSAALLGPGKTRADLRALIADGFVGSVDYLFWDDEDPSRVTLKVSHESFIRGWARFRSLVDAESERFDEFVAALRKCAIWCARGRDDELLLEAGDLRRLADVDVAAMLGSPAERGLWFRFLLLDRDGARLARLEPEFDAYVRASASRQKQIERSSKRSRLIWVSTIALALVLLPSAMFSLLIQEPVTKRALLFFQAGNLANGSALPQAYADANSAAASLESLLRAARLIDSANSGQGDLMARVSELLLQKLHRIPAVRRQAVLLDGVAGLVEPPVNGRLRDALASSLWPAPAPLVSALPAPLAEPMKCDVGGAGPADGLLFTVATSGLEATRRSLFVQLPVAGRDETFTLRVAAFDPVARRCTAQQSVMAIPLFIDPYIVVDASLRYFMFTQQGENVEVPSVTVHEIDWDRNEDGSSRLAGRRQRAVVIDPVVVEAVQKAAGERRVAAVPTHRTASGRSFELAGRRWQIVSRMAQRIDPPAETPLRELPAAAPGSPCAVLGGSRPSQEGFRLEMFDGGEYCFAIARGNPPERNAAPNGDGGEALREEVLVAVYGRPDAGPGDEVRRRLAENPPAAIATLNRFARVRAGAARWFVGSGGAYDGWVVLRTPDRAGDEAFYGAPWSTCALARQGWALLGTPADCGVAAAR